MTEGPKFYRVAWVIELSAESPVEAAKLALEIQRDPESLAVVFDVQEILSTSRRIDLRNVPHASGGGPTVAIDSGSL